MTRSSPLEVRWALGGCIVCVDLVMSSLIHVDVLELSYLSSMRPPVEELFQTYLLGVRQTLKDTIAMQLLTFTVNASQRDVNRSTCAYQLHDR